MKRKFPAINIWKNVWMGVLLLSGCAVIGQQLIDKPLVEYRGMEIRSLSPFQMTPVFLFDLRNTNPMGLNVTDITYDLKINGRKFVKGVSGQTIRLKAIGSGKMELSVPFNILDLQDASGARKKTIRYELSGTIRIEPYVLPYETSGEFVLPKMPRITLKEILIKESDGRKTDSLFVLELENPNDFQLVTDTIAYVFRLENTEVGDGAVALSEAVAAQSRVRISVPVRTLYSGKDSPEYRVLQSSSAMYEISGAMIFNSPEARMRKIPFQNKGKVSLLR